MRSETQIKKQIDNLKHEKRRNQDYGSPCCECNQFEGVCAGCEKINGKIEVLKWVLSDE